MARFQKICLALLIGLMATWIPDAHGQKRYETIQLKTGRTVTGEILEVKPKSIVLLRRLSKGSIKEELPFSRLEPGSLYTALVSALRPLDREAHRRIGDAAYLAGLYATAKRHYKKSSTDEKALTPKLQELVAQCETKDLEKLLKRSTDELVKEKFKRSRDLALLAMKRYPAHPQAKTIPEHLQRIKRRHDAARRRDAAMAKTRKEKAVWDAAEKTLGKLEQRIKKAETYESKSLRSTSRLRRSKGYIDLGLRELYRADRSLLKLRQSKAIPSGLKPRLNAIDDHVLAMQIRLRLHLTSLYTVRGSFGTALAWANEALSFDPTDKSAIDARSRVEAAAAAASARGNRGGVVVR